MPRSRRDLVLTVAAVVTLFAQACASPATPPAPIRVVATTSLFADLAQNVAGTRLAVGALAPAGVSVEDFSPSPADARKAANADVIFVNGLSLDRWSEPLVRDRKPGATVVVLSDGLPRLGVGESANPDMNQNGNPHYWFDVTYAKAYVEKIRDALTTADRAGASTYATNATAYLAKLDALDAEIRTTVARIPRERRKLVTSHDAWPYFAKAYGFTIVGFATPEPGKDPSPAELAALVDRIRAEKVPAIFSEAAFSPRIAQTLAAEAGVKTVVTDLVTDSLGPPPADSYVGLMRFDVDRIAGALR